MNVFRKALGELIGYLSLSGAHLCKFACTVLKKLVLLLKQGYV